MVVHSCCCICFIGMSAQGLNSKVHLNSNRLEFQRIRKEKGKETGEAQFARMGRPACSIGRPRPRIGRSPLPIGRPPLRIGRPAPHHSLTSQSHPSASSSSPFSLSSPRTGRPKSLASPSVGSARQDPGSPLKAEP
jgi:hypothetical protein